MKQYLNKSQSLKNNTKLLSNDHAAMSNFFPFYEQYYTSILKYCDSGTTMDVTRFDDMLEDFLKRGLSEK